MGNLTRCIGSHDYDMGKDGFDAYVRTTFRTLCYQPPFCDRSTPSPNTNA